MPPRGVNPVHAGHYISGAGHLALIGWLLLGDVFSADPLPFDVTQAAMVSVQDYEALVQAARAPRPAPAPEQPEAPAATPVPEAPAPVQDAAAPQATPDAAPAPANETAPQVPEQALPPQAEAQDQIADLPTPDPIAEAADLAPQLSARPVPRAAERIAPEPVAPPPPEALPDPQRQDAITVDQSGERPQDPQDPQEATAPPEAASRIVTEADTPSGAPRQSLRPPLRPVAPSQAVARPAPASDPAPSDPVAQALAEALAAPAPAPGASGPPLSAAEKEGLRVAVSNCWNVGSLSSEALRTTVVVRVALDAEARPIASTITLASSDGGSQTAARQAFEAARRAIIRCGAKGFGLPSEKYSQWQDIEMTFNPERMRVK